MDSAETITHVSLCAGYGGIDLGLKRAIPNLRTIAFSEIEAFACANLVAKMEAQLLDAAPIWTNLKTFPWESFRGKVGILSGGYPCQPFSSAGKRLGADDPRHLWPYIADGIARMQPTACFFENVEGHITLGLRNVIDDLGRLGYRTTWGIFSASEVGAPHQRKRVFILAHRKGHERSQPESGDGWTVPPRGMQKAWPSRPSEPQHQWEPPRIVGDTAFMQRNGCDDNAGSGERPEAVSESRDPSWTDAVGVPPCELFNGYWTGPREAGRTKSTNSGWRQAKPTLGGNLDGPSGGLDYAELCVSSDNRTDELRLLGNGVVPATAERAFLTLIKRLT